MIKDLDFSDEFEFNVEVYHADQSIFGEGRLTFGGGGLICIQLERAHNYKTAHTVPPILKAKSKDGQRFTLFNCETAHNQIYAKYIACGNIDSDAGSIQVKYAEISDWFMHDQYLEGELGESLTWKNPTPQLSISIETDEEDFSLKTETFSSLTRRGENHIIHEHIRFIFERPSGTFAIEEVRDKAFELSTLLSILTATPVSIESVWGSFDSKYCVPIYFPSFKKIDSSSSSGAYWVSCLALRALLDDHWQSIFERFYASPYRKTTWVRLAGMQRYEGFWEFKILGYVSLLDEYVSTSATIANCKSTKAETTKVTKLKEKIQRLSKPLDDDQSEEVRSLIDSIFVTSRDLTFLEKYELARSNTNDDILKVINLTDDDFRLIKRIRDKVAHGVTPDLQDTSYQELHLIIEKIALLMTYWAHIDLGLSHSDFAIFLKRTHNPLQFNSALNKFHLDRITNSAEFIHVPEGLFEKFTSGEYSIINACFTQNAQNELTYSEAHKAMFNNWINDRSRKSNQVIDAFGADSVRTRSPAGLYLECADKHIQLHMAYIIKDY